MEFFFVFLNFIYLLIFKNLKSFLFNPNPAKIEAPGMKKNLHIVSLVGTLYFVSVTIPGWAYQEIEVKNGEQFKARPH